MRFLIRNVVVIQISLMLCVLVWVFGGLRGDLQLSYVPWLFALMFEGMICFPQRHHDETPVMARERVWEEMREDPLVWLSTAFLALLLVPFVNKGLCPQCDYPAIMMGANPNPPVSFLPSCLDRLEHLNVFQWFAISLTAMVAVKHALLKRGKRAILEVLVWNGVALGALGFVQQSLKAPGPLWVPQVPSHAYFFSVFGYANMAGDYFTSLFILSLALWRQRVAENARSERTEEDRSGDKVVAERDRFWRSHYLLIAAALLYYSALNTLSRSAILMATVSAILLLVHVATTSLARMHRVQRVRRGALMAVAVVVLAIFASLFMPDKFGSELKGTTVNEALDRVTGRSEYHSSVAMKLFKEHVLFGTGGWSYRHRCVPLLPKGVADNLKYEWSTGGANVHNDYLQFMVEHGLVGFVFFVAVLLFLLIPVFRVWLAMAKSVRFGTKQGLPFPRGFFVFPFPALAILVAALTTLIHAFADCPLRCPSVMALLLVELAAVDGFLPTLITERKDPS